MKRILRTTPVNIANVTFQGSGHSSNLHASDIVVEVLGHRVILSLDLSPSQPRGGETSYSYIDAENMKENFGSLKFLQLDREPWLEEGLLRAVRDATRPIAFELVISFKDGAVRSTPATLDIKDTHNFWIYPR
jgi:hypothetical protein